jgi:hypothetical protein
MSEKVRSGCRDSRGNVDRVEMIHIQKLQSNLNTHKMLTLCFYIVANTKQKYRVVKLLPDQMSVANIVSK